MNKNPRQSEQSTTSSADAGPLVGGALAGVQSQLPLVELFLALAEDADGGPLRTAARRLADELQRGVALGAALRSVEGELPPYLRRALEASTDDAQVLAVIEGLMQHEASRKRLRRQMQTVLIYPTVVVVLLLGILAGMSIYVVPQFEETFRDLDMEIPSATRVAIGLSRVLPATVAAVALLPVIYLVMAIIPPTRRLAHWLRTGVPFLGRIWIWNGQHEFASVLGALVSRRVNLDEALACTVASLGDRNVARAARIAADKCEGGALLSRSLSESIHFDPTLTALVAWGEAHSALPQALDEATAAFEEAIDLRVEFLRRVLPAALMIVVVATILTFVSGLAIPLISMINNLSTWPPPATAGPAPMIDGFIAASLILVMLCLCYRVAMRLLYGARGPTTDDSVYLFMRILSWGLLLAPAAVLTIVTAGVCVEMGRAAMMPAGILLILSVNWVTLLCFAVLLESTFELVISRRAVQRRAAWRLVTASLARSRSAVDSLRFHEPRFSGIVGRWFRRLVDDLDRGVAWPLAIWKNRRAFPREAPTLAAMIDLTAGDAETRRQLDDYGDPAFQEQRQQLVQRSVYLVSVVTVIISVMIFVMVKIVPSYQAIFDDFGLTLPAITEHLISFSDSFQRYFGIPAFVLIAMCVALSIAGLFYLCDVPVLRPLTDRLTFFRHRAQVLRLLAAGFERGKTVDAALGQLTSGWSRYPSRVVRRRLQRVLGWVTAALPWQEALERASLVSVGDVAVLNAAQQAGNLPWAMRMLADRKMRLGVFRWTIAHQFVFAAIVLVLALFVLWVGVAMIYPLADLVSNLSG